MFLFLSLLPLSNDGFLFSWVLFIDLRLVLYTVTILTSGVKLLYRIGIESIHCECSNKLRVFHPALDGLRAGY
jgi:hypothetical protein